MTGTLFISRSIRSMPEGILAVDPGAFMDKRIWSLYQNGFSSVQREREREIQLRRVQ